MEDIYKNQVDLHVAMSKIVTNLKKDSSDRKSLDYFKRRLETLEAYWADYQYNHDRLTTEGSRSHPYFVKNEYEQVCNVYKSAKALIHEQQQAFLRRKAEESSGYPRTEQQASHQGEASRQQGSGGAGQSSDYEDAQQSTSTRQTSKGSCSKLDDVFRRQSSNFRAFLRTVSAIDLSVISQKWELEDAIRSLQARWSIIDALHWELDSELDEMDEAYERTYAEHEHTFNELKKAINCKLWSVSHRETWTPRMEIPTFSGNYQSWVSFKDLFVEAIHNNISISNAQKMQFLKGKLRGEAERLIQHLPISTENYSVAWEILNNRYNNIRLIFSTHANILLNLPTTQQPSANHIKKIHDTTQECLNAIKNLGVDTSSWDPLIVHILIQKLDSESHNSYLESLKNPRDLPNLQDFLKLKKKFTTLESSRKKQDTYFKPSSNLLKYNSNSKYFKSNNYSTKPFGTINKGGHWFPNNNNSAKMSCPLCKEMHGLYFCNKFLNMTPQDKRNTLTSLNLYQNCLYSHGNKDCTSEKRCRECNGAHNTLVHEAFKNSSVNITIFNINQVQASNENSVLQQGNNMNEILLATAVIKVQARDGSFHKMRALIDQGSQISLITENASQVLALPRKRCKGLITGVGAKESSCKGIAEITCNSLYNNFSLKTKVFIMNTLIKNLPSCTFSKSLWSHLEGIQLSDPDFNISRPIDILLGADVYSHIIMDGISRSDQVNLPIAQQTRFGWILCGNVQTLQCNVVLNQVDELRKFWETEDIFEESNLSEEDIRCVKYYKSITKRRENGSYEVRIPFKENFEEQLGSSKHIAIAQFHQLEKKFRNDSNIEQQYKSFINEYKYLGHMKHSTCNQKPHYYLPHHCVLRTESSTTALRVVFNASTKTTLGFSLNDLMLKGPNLQQDLQSLLLKWRQFRYAFTADIEKMFRCIWVNKHDQQFQKIIWRDSYGSCLQEYQLCTVTYGTKAALFLAMMTLKQLADDERCNYQTSNAIQVLEQSFYMDVLHGAETVQAALHLQQDLIKLLKSGNFNLRKWKSNCQELLMTNRVADISKEDNFEFKQPESTKTLGLRWSSRQDTFTFQSQIEQMKKTPTKRSILSDISKLYDPLGWLSPVSTRLKLLFQKVWTSNIQWDEKLSDNLVKEWISIREDLAHINELKIKRWLYTSEVERQLELHGFCDSSNKAYACIIYSRTTFQGDIKISLVAGKARLVPANKPLSLPKLELSGALLLATLMEKVQKCFSKYNLKIFGWVDSMVVLAWLQGDPGRWKPFVANRVRRITEVMRPEQWHYVKSAENPADCASRDMSAIQLKEHSLRWMGPPWLLDCSTRLDSHTSEVFKTNEEIRKNNQVNLTTLTSSVIEELLTRFSSFQKLTRVFAWILRFIYSIRQKQKGESSYLTLSNQQPNIQIKDIVTINDANQPPGK